ncbi:hypothetical protein Ancab_034736 [Ancistrocladus abbreviatus]
MVEIQNQGHSLGLSPRRIWGYLSQIGIRGSASDQEIIQKIQSMEERDIKRFQEMEKAQQEKQAEEDKQGNPKQAEVPPVARAPAPRQGGQAANPPAQAPQAASGPPSGPNVSHLDLFAHAFLLICL